MEGGCCEREAGPHPFGDRGLGLYYQLGRAQHAEPEEKPGWIDHAGYCVSVGD